MPAIEINASSSICRKCGTAYGRLKGYFPVSYALLYKGTGYLPYCKDCVDGMYNAYLMEIKDPKKAVRQMCRKLDLYWSEKVYDAVQKQNSNRTMMTSYISKVNALKIGGKSYDDTLREEGVFWVEPVEYESFQPEQGEASAEEEPGRDVPEIYVPEDVIEFWGSGFEPEFVLKLDKRYKQWTDGADLDKGSVSLYKQICILEEMINKDAAEGKPVDKNVNMLNTLLGSANLKPVQKKSEADAAMEATPLGVWIDRWEHKRPVPEPDPMFKDVDGIIRYISIWFYGHISKTLGIKNIYCDMYEKEMARMKVERQELVEEGDDDEASFNSIFGGVEV